MARLPGNSQLTDLRGRPLFTLRDINCLPVEEKLRIYGRLLPRRLLAMFAISPETFRGPDGGMHVQFIAPAGLGFLRVVVRRTPTDRDAVFFLEITDTQFQQMELAFCVIKNVAVPRYDVDLDSTGRDNCFATLGRNVAEEVRAMEAGLYPNQTHPGLRMFNEFFMEFERFVDSLGMEVIVAEPLSYDNAIRYERLGFDYITGRTFMEQIDEGFRPGNRYQLLLDDSTPFRRRGGEQTLHGRSWAIHDGILGVPWDGLSIYRQVGMPAPVINFHPCIPDGKH